MSNAPTAEYRDRRDVVPPDISLSAFRPYWRAEDRVEKLRFAGLITTVELAAATAFRMTFERAYAGALGGQDWNFVRIDRHCRRATEMPSLSDRQAAALLRVRSVAQALGELFRVLVWVVVDELCWAEIARRLGIDYRTARHRSAAAIAALAAL